MPNTARAFVSVIFSALLFLVVHSGRQNRRNVVVARPQNQEHRPKLRRKLVEDEITDGPLLNEEIVSNNDKNEQELTPEEITEKQIKQYLGGLYPKVDRNFMPLYLRDTLQPRKVDPKWGEIVDGDLPFFWHIPKASGSTMKNIMNFCFNLKRAEKVYGEAYVASDEYIGNWMVHQLTGTMPWVELTDDHLAQAKSVLQAKVFVGIASQMDETLRQLKRYFHWIEERPFCVFNYLHSTPTNSNSHPKIQRGSAQWLEVAEKEKWDLSLYYYALELFAQQRERFPPEDRGGEALVNVMDPHRRS
eukprot:CCRYP_009717-RA/>CCRYP_009717-RA protein AED:0.37 eAED:0.37 QI:88/0.5/0.66/1/0.5/0.66/3/0/302